MQALDDLRSIISILLCILLVDSEAVRDQLQVNIARNVAVEDCLEYTSTLFHCCFH